ncbi:MAG: hypothetical protein SynsKO_33580 [Synoicihabitans sp.]
MSESGKARPSVLVVDDEAPLLEIIQKQLQDEFRVETASSAEEADLHLGSASFDLVLADHMMPGEAGLDFLMRVREHFPETKRILMTGYLNPELISRAQSLAGLSAYLIKPVSAEQLLAAVRGALS